MGRMKKHEIAAETGIYTASPSDFAFLWDDCKRCFWLKYKHGINKPSSPFPRVFGLLDQAQKQMFRGLHTSKITSTMPRGRCVYSDEWVNSVPIGFKGTKTKIALRGIFDTVIQLDGGGYCVMDYKTTIPNSNTLPKYQRQLETYAFAISHPAKGKKKLAPAKEVGLLCLEPLTMGKVRGMDYQYNTRAVWMGTRTNERAFRRFLREVVALLDSEKVPDPGERCSLCEYRALAREMEW